MNRDDSKIVYDPDAYEALQGLRNGLFRDVIEKIGQIVSTRASDEPGPLHVTMRDVQEAFAAVAQQYIEEQQHERKQIPA